MPGMTLNASDAAELAELLQFLSGWLARDRGRLGASLAGFVGNHAYTIGQLRDDLDRFTASPPFARHSNGHHLISDWEFNEIVTVLVWAAAIPINVFVVPDFPWSIFVVAGTRIGLFFHWFGYRPARPRRPPSSAADRGTRSRSMTR